MLKKSKSIVVFLSYFLLPMVYARVSANYLLQGTEKAFVNSKQKTEKITYSYDNYIVISSKNNTGNGYCINIYCKRKNKALMIPIHLRNSFFQGIIDGIAIFDSGTSNDRNKYFYSLEDEKLIDSLINCQVGNNVIKNHSLTLIRKLPKSMVKCLKLPKCQSNNSKLPSGAFFYAQEVSYNFLTRKKTYSHKFYCRYYE